MVLNYKVFFKQRELYHPIVLIHGLFGNLYNLRIIADYFKQYNTTVQIDVRNHGKSFWSDKMNYHLMSQDILHTLDAINIHKFVAIGHSMGGKIAMSLSYAAPKRISKIISIDMAPIAYKKTNLHKKVLLALQSINHINNSKRTSIFTNLNKIINDRLITQFLLKSFNRESKWDFNILAINKNYKNIIGWNKLPSCNIPLLIIFGGQSYFFSSLKEKHHKLVIKQFPNVKYNIISEAGHWVHYDNPKSLIYIIQKYLY